MASGSPIEELRNQVKTGKLRVPERDEKPKEGTGDVTDNLPKKPNLLEEWDDAEDAEEIVEYGSTFASTNAYDWRPR